MARGFVSGVLAAVAAAALAGWAFIYFGAMDARADSPPGKFEEWAARKSLRATLRRGAKKGPPPLQPTDANLLAGLKVYAANCAVCHGAADGKSSKIADGLYQGPPQFASDSVADDAEGKIYWFIEHGVRLTGMPAFGKSLSQDELWQVTLFLKHMEKLPPAVQKGWKAVPSQAQAGR